jgi:hypothetical protein
MTRKELETVLKVLSRIKDKDAHVGEAILIINKNIERYNKMKGQLKEQYDIDRGPWP